jgi:hypothetical protein
MGEIQGDCQGDQTLRSPGPVLTPSPTGRLQCGIEVGRNSLWYSTDSDSVLVRERSRTSRRRIL